MTVQQGASFGRMVVVLVAVVIVLAGMRLSAPVLNPILFAIASPSSSPRSTLGCGEDSPPGWP